MENPLAAGDGGGTNIPLNSSAAGHRQATGKTWPRNQETTMRTALLYCLAQARIADLSRHTAQAPAVAAGQARRPPSKNRAPARWPLTHRNPR